MEAFARAQIEHERNLTKQREIQGELEELFERRRDSLRKAVPSEEMHAMQLGHRALEEAMRLCRLELQKTQATLDEKSKALFQARQKREAIEKINEKQLAGYRAHVSRQEQKLADDLATMKSLGALALKWR